MKMNKTLGILATVAAVSIFGCEMSHPRGGGMTSADSFNIVVPAAQLQLKQGAVQTVDVGVVRGENFKQDVKLDVKSTPGITTDPNNVLVKASAKPEAQIRIAAAKDAALGEYRVTVTGTPGTGPQTLAEFRVNVVAP